ncbi:unnamed protein product [Symbiodinium natans]|uniref:RRM domain-containing protein n=1 Tax=Symbiodinium natans TaxID=878477 RepID=A0A812PN33_9DINO|nr:unnamed protein product [Symbiodinium natans]
MQNWGIPAFGKGNTQPPPAYGKASPELAQASGPYGDKAKPELKPGDWICPQCGDHQFARNWFCKMCARSGGGNDPMAAMMAMMMAGGFSGGKGNQVKGDPQFLVYVANIDWKAQWQDLKDHMKQAGTVQFCSILTEDGTDWGRSKGMACVRYATVEEAANAVATLNGSEFKGRPLKVDHWTGKTASA